LFDETRPERVAAFREHLTGLIAAELERNEGSVTRSARALRIAKTTLTDKIRKYGLATRQATP